MKLDLLVTGRIATFAGATGFGWVDAIGIAGGRVAIAGSVAEVRGAATIVGRRLDVPPDHVAIPGLTDAHIHLADLALAAEEIDLGDAPTLDAGLALIGRAHAATRDPDAWLNGHGWDAVRWGGWPTAAALESVAPGRRIALWAHDHHSIWASEAALRAAGIDASTPDPDGGVIRRAADGAPDGVLQEAAVPLVLRHVPPPAEEALDELVVRACRSLLSFGVVAAHDPGEVASDVDLTGGFAAYERLGARGRLPIRVHASVRPESLDLAIGRGARSGAPLGGEGSRATVGWLKIFADGTLGARTARMLAPYEPAPDAGEPPNGGYGVDVRPPEEVRLLATRAAAAGIATQVHAIGDAANRSALATLAAVGRCGPLMPRVEHAQLVDLEDLPRFARDGIAAAVMPRDIRSDRRNAYRFWGARRTEHGSYAYGSLARTGAVIPFATDAPVEAPDPWPSIVSAVTRRGPDDAPSDAFVPREALTLDRALRAAALDAAVAAGEPDRGRLLPGCRADLAVIPAAALVEPVDPRGALETVRPRLVLLDGVVAHEA